MQREVCRKRTIINNVNDRFRTKYVSDQATHQGDYAWGGKLKIIMGVCLIIIIMVENNRNI